MHYIMVVFLWWRKAADDPIEEIGISAIEQSFEPVELIAVESGEVLLGKSAKNEIALLRSPMPAAEQQPSESDSCIVVL
jgi:hypothetical protein